VPEVLFGQDTEGVGRTSDVSGSLTIDGTTIAATEIEVDLTTVASDSSQRDNQFRNRIMETSTYPTATFSLASPITLEDVPDDLEEVTVQATGQLTLHGVTNTVTMDLAARRNGDAIEVTGSVPVAFADYGIDNPSFGGISVGDSGTMEFAVVFARS
jgi:polyisoprenoid-binding protein YceI